MKKIILFLVALLVIPTATAQKINFQGDKMVGKLEIESYNYGGNINNPVYSVGRTTIKFGYDNTHLTSVEAKSQVEFMNKKNGRFGDTEECTFKLSKNTLVRKDYFNGRQKKTGEWKYIFDGDIVTKTEYYDYSVDGSGECLRDDANFYYTTTDKGFPILYRSLKEWYVKMAGTRHFVKGDDDNSGIVQIYRQRNGDVDIKQLSTPRSEANMDDFDIKYVYTQMPNDTNINWLVFGASFAQWDGFNEILPMTEWIPCKSAHLPLENKHKNIVFSYLYDCGNLVRVDITSSGKLTKTIKVTYVK